MNWHSGVERVPRGGSALNHAAKAIEIEDIEARVSERERSAGASASQRYLASAQERRISMKAMSRRLAKLENRFASRIATPDGWAKDERMKRIEGIRTRLLSEGHELEGHTEGR